MTKLKIPQGRMPKILKRNPFLLILSANLLLLCFLAMRTLAQSNESITRTTNPQQAIQSAPLANAGTAFTYQGQLVDDNNPANGVYDFQFGLFDAAAAGSQIGAVQAINNISVNDGLFTVNLDFGTDAFNGQARWLEIAVKRDADGSYTLLSPRVALTPAPQALTLPGLWTQQNGTSPNLIGGYAGNVMGAGVTGGTINGGGYGGFPNRIYDHYNTVGGGAGNVAGADDGITQDSATVSGGRGNSASATYSTIGGGQFNNASAINATIGGGQNNNASAVTATIGGGRYNIASGTIATIGGGNNNIASASYATVGGGYYNRAAADYATIAGGGPSDTANPSTTNNRVYDNYGTVSGGANNVAGTNDSNSTNQDFATVSGGTSNNASGSLTVISGGNSNNATAYAATIGGGGYNTAGNMNAVVGGGYHNNASGDTAAIGGGRDNIANSARATVGGGIQNTASGVESVVGGGSGNNATGASASVIGGLGNDATADYAVVGGGWNNEASGIHATVPGGESNLASGRNSFAAGRRAQAIHDGAFVWADTTNINFTSTTTDSFSVRAANGAYIFANSDGNGLSLINSGANGVGLYTQGSGSGKTRATLQANNTETNGGIAAYLTNNSNYSTVHAYNGSNGEVLYLQNGGDSAGGGGGDFIKAVDEAQTDAQFRVTTTGEVRSDVGFNTPSADFAEMLPGVPGLEAGDVLAIGLDGRLTRTTEAYQPTVVGVYSTQPGFVGGMPVEGEAVGRIPLAVVGVVPVKVTVESGEIQPGDLLTSSAVPGHAMKAVPNAPQGTIIGKALEPLAEGTGVILMLVILQ